jgi:hypothetical protein
MRKPPALASKKRGRLSISATRQRDAAAGEPGAVLPASSNLQTPPLADVPSDRGRQMIHDAPSRLAAAGEGEAHRGSSPDTATPALADVFAEIREQHRQRQDYHSAEKRLTNQIKAIWRRMSGGLSGSAAHENRAAGAEEDGDQADTATSPEAVEPGPPSAAVRLATVHLEAARDSLTVHRRRHEARMAELAVLLPVWTTWAVNVRGIGPLGLAQIVGEAGDVGTYRTVSGLWKRMGLAVIAWCDTCGARADGAAHCQACGPEGNIRRERQRRIKGDAAFAHGFSAPRRAIMWNIGEALVKQNRDGAYRTLYLERKAIEAARMPAGTKKGHIHNRARRYMEKRFLRDLWLKWTGEAPRA